MLKVAQAFNMMQQPMVCVVDGTFNVIDHMTKAVFKKFTSHIIAYKFISF